VSHTPPTLDLGFLTDAGQLSRERGSNRTRAHMHSHSNKSTRMHTRCRDAGGRREASSSSRSKREHSRSNSRSSRSPRSADEADDGHSSKVRRSVPVLIFISKRCLLVLLCVCVTATRMTDCSHCYFSLWCVFVTLMGKSSYSPKRNVRRQKA